MEQQNIITLVMIIVLLIFFVTVTLVYPVLLYKLQKKYGELNESLSPTASNLIKCNSDLSDCNAKYKTDLDTCNTQLTTAANNYSTCQSLLVAASTATKTPTSTATKTPTSSPSVATKTATTTATK